MNLILNVNKPAGISSARVVSIVKRLLPRGTKIGHAGTLDPFATGVLLLLVGKATKRCEELMHQGKQYITTVKFGATTDTDDPESPEVLVPEAPIISLEQVRAVLPQFKGTIEQIPPKFSAIKVGGRRAYDLARKDKPVVLSSRPVRIDQIEIMRFEYPELDLRIDCGRGTYIRAIARDLGIALHSGAYLKSLVRTRIGEFAIEQSLTLEQLRENGIPLS